MRFPRAIFAALFSFGLLPTYVDAAFLSLGPWNHHARHDKLTLIPRSKIFSRSGHPKQCRLISAPDNSQGVFGPPPSKTTTHAPRPTGTAPPSSASGLIQVESAGACQDIGATKAITTLAGPNGAIDWLNCGVNTSGWNPTFVAVNDIITQDLSTALAENNSPFAPCTPYLDIFNKYSQQYGIPPILAASFAMQESTCNPNTIGGAGEQGMMQITPDKCTGAPKGNCLDPDFNIRTGISFFADTLNSTGGNVLLAVGQYNGWYQGMTYTQATAAANTTCCHCQQNLDYVHQFFNGWCQGIDPFSANMGEYFNLKVCTS